MMTTSSHRSSTRSSWWLENSTVAPGGRHLREQFGHGAHGDGIEPGERLVEHEQVGLVDQRGDQLHALLVAVRQRVKAVARPPGEAEPLQPRVDGPAHVPARPPAQLAQVDELLPHPHAGIQAALLRHVAEPCPLRSPIGAPRQRTVPVSSSTSPNTARIAVVLPAPFGPRKPVSRPGWTANVQPSSAASAPKRLVTASNSSTISPRLNRTERQHDGVGPSDPKTAGLDGQDVGP